MPRLPWPGHLGCGRAPAASRPRWAASRPHRHLDRHASDVGVDRRHPANPSIALGTTQQFTATGTYSDNSTQDLTAQSPGRRQRPRWRRSATPRAQGLATSVAAGTTHHRHHGRLTSASVTLTVTPADVGVDRGDAADPEHRTGLTQAVHRHRHLLRQLDPGSDRHVTWASATTSAATISNAAGSHGLATSVAPGTSSITAAVGGITSAPHHFDRHARRRWCRSRSHRPGPRFP